MRHQNTCHYCYQKGHNRRTCPKLQKDALTGDKYAAATIAKNTTSNSSRKCGYCGDSGHNAATCEQKTIQQNEIRSKTIFFRKQFVEHCTKIGLNVGALIEILNQSLIENYGRHNEPRIAMIVSFNERYINSETLSPYCSYVIKAKDSKGVHLTLGAPASLYEELGMAYPYANTQYKVISPVRNHKMPANITNPDFVLGRDDLSYLYVKVRELSYLYPKDTR